MFSKGFMMHIHEELEDVYIYSFLGSLQSLLPYSSILDHEFTLLHNSSFHTSSSLYVLVEYH